jgi:hypothetical protein
MDKLSLATFWMTSCNQIHDLAHKLGSPAANLMTAIAQKYCQQPVPETEEELDIRQNQGVMLIGTIQTLDEAGEMARVQPAVANEILTEARRRVEADLPRTNEEFAAYQHEGSSLIAKLQAICHGDRTRRGR